MALSAVLRCSVRGSLGSYVPRSPALGTPVFPGNVPSDRSQGPLKGGPGGTCWERTSLPFPGERAPDGGTYVLYA